MMGFNISKGEMSMDEELSVFQHNIGTGYLSLQSQNDQKRESLNAKFKKARLQDHGELGIFVIFAQHRERV